MLELYVLTLTLALLGVLWSEWKGRQVGVWLGKPVASVMFVLIAFLYGAPETAYGQWVLAGLLLSLVGDVLLIPRGRPSFVIGLAAFLVAHLAFAGAFLMRPQSLPDAALAGAVMAVLGGGVLRWLWPHLNGGMRGPVIAYLLAIGLMVSIAGGAATFSPSLLVAALLFAVSDVLVARQRFVSPGIANRLVGLPLYYAAQVLFAMSV